MLNNKLFRGITDGITNVFIVRFNELNELNELKLNKLNKHDLGIYL